MLNLPLVLGTFNSGHGRSEKQQDENTADNFKNQHGSFLLVAISASRRPAAVFVPLRERCPQLGHMTHRKIVASYGTKERSGGWV
jgi:hypothetical protein